LIVTTSPRTEPDVVRTLRAGLGGVAPNQHLFAPFDATADNPYKAMLALADHFVVSVDSASMVAEAATRQKPIFLFHLPKISPTIKPGLKSAVSRNWRLRRKARQDAGERADPMDKLYDFWTRRGKARPRRDIDQLENRLIELGIAQPLGSASGENQTPLTPLREEIEKTVSRIQDLWAKRSQQT
jgi:hypothetical protein